MRSGLRRGFVIGYVVRCRSARLWSGHGPGDRKNPALGHKLVDSRAKAKVFASLREAREEAATYNDGGAKILRVREVHCGVCGALVKGGKT